MQLKRRLLLLSVVGLTAFQKPSMKSDPVSPPTSETSFNTAWRLGKTGVIYITSYFDEGQVDDPAWEMRRLSTLGPAGNHMSSAEIIRSVETGPSHACATGSKITRYVRWFPATPVSGRKCAAVIYAIACDTPNSLPNDTFDLDRQEALQGEMSSVPAASCGEKNLIRPLSKSARDMREYLNDQSMLVDRSVCDFQKSSIDGRIRVLPRTRISVSNVIDRDLAVRLPVPWRAMDVLYYGTDGPRAVIAGALRAAGRMSSIFPPDHVTGHSRADIHITQAVGVGRDGRPYCVQLTAQQGGQTWRRTIERSGKDGYAGIGIGDKDSTGEPVHSVSNDDRDLLMALAISLGLPSDKENAKYDDFVMSNDVD